MSFPFPTKRAYSFYSPMNERFQVFYEGRMVAAFPLSAAMREQYLGGYSTATREVYDRTALRAKQMAQDLNAGGARRERALRAAGA